MNNTPVKASLVERTSKAGNPYMAVEIVLAPGCTKLVFLSQAEVALIRMTSTPGTSPVQTKA